jgi:flagellar hook-associated protein 3 FlgL
MMSPISTASLYSSLAANIGTSQTQEATYTGQLSSQKIATDLAGYGASAGSLTAVNSVSSRLTTYVANAQALSGKLDVQDQALSQVATAAQSARTAVADALANNSGADLMTTLQSQLSTAAGALNTQYDGQYLFSGGQATTAPVAASQLSDLTAASPLSSVFKNGQTAQVSRLDDSTVVKTGVLASDAGTPLMTALAAVQAYDAGPNGPLSGTLTTAQSSFLSGVLSQFDTAISSANTTVADNGVVAQQVTDKTTQLTDQQTAIAGVVSNMTTPDEAQVATQLSLAQTTLQASAQIFSSLQSDSLLQVLSPTAA